MARLASAYVQGLTELDRDLRTMGNRGARRALYRGLRAAGTVVRDEARSRIRGQFTQRTGDLHSGTRVTRATPRAVVIASTARHRGYPYPARFEYGGRGAGGQGPRAFMEPALEAKAGEAVRVLEHRLHQVLTEHNL
jgi:hypothetical protein